MRLDIFRSWIQELGLRLFSASLVALVTVVLLALLTFVLVYYFNEPPFAVTVLTTPPTAPVCPGDIYDVWAEIDTEHTVVIFVYVTNKTLNGNHVVHPDQPVTTVIPVSGDITFKQSFQWHVPDLPPGIPNNRVLGFRGHDTDEEPLIFGDAMPIEAGQVFTVATQAECLAREKPNE